MAVIKINPAVSLEKWGQYVDSHPRGKFCHLPVWKSIVQESLHHEPYYLFAFEDARICGILPLFLIKSALTGNHLVSFPFFPSAGPIADSQELAVQLVSAAADLSHHLDCRYLELRMDEEFDTGLAFNDYYSTYMLEITDPGLIWNRMHQKSVRWAIGKAKKEGVSVKKSLDDRELDYFYAIHFLTKKKLGLPCHPFSFFRSISVNAAPHTDLFIAQIGSVPIAGIICFKYKNTIEYAYGASDPQYLRCHANHLLVWQAILDAFETGYRNFDFGRTAPDNEGLCRYKRHWGGTRMRLYNYYYPEIPGNNSQNVKRLRYRLATGAWQKLPLAAARALNRFACKELD